LIAFFKYASEETAQLVYCISRRATLGSVHCHTSLSLPYRWRTRHRDPSDNRPLPWPLGCVHGGDWGPSHVNSADRETFPPRRTRRYSSN